MFKQYNPLEVALLKLQENWFAIKGSFQPIKTNEYIVMNNLQGYDWELM
jgi:hypothetical protein